MDMWAVRTSLIRENARFDTVGELQVVLCDHLRSLPHLSQNALAFISPSDYALSLSQLESLRTPYLGGCGPCLRTLELIRNLENGSTNSILVVPKLITCM